MLKNYKNSERLKNLRNANWAQNEGIWGRSADPLCRTNNDLHSSLRASKLYVMSPKLTPEVQMEKQKLTKWNHLGCELNCIDWFTDIKNWGSRTSICRTTFDALSELNFSVYGVLKCPSLKGYDLKCIDCKYICRKSKSII